LPLPVAPVGWQGDAGSSFIVSLTSFRHRLWRRRCRRSFRRRKPVRQKARYLREGPTAV